MKKASYFLITLGILIMMYPLFNNLYKSYWEQRLLSEFDITEDVHENYQLLNEFFYEDFEYLGVIEAEYEPEIEEEEKKEEKVNPNNILGTLEIAKINLRLPVLLGTSSNNLRRAAGHLTGTNMPGEIGNSVIAAHRGHSYGSLFNRLEELEVGDKIIVNTKSGRSEYIVYEMRIVEPTDLSVLRRNNENRILTLITCTYDATHRVIVHAKM